MVNKFPKTTIAVLFNLLQVRPSVPSSVHAVLFTSSFNVNFCVVKFFCFSKFSGRSDCLDFDKFPEIASNWKELKQQGHIRTSTATTQFLSKDCKNSALWAAILGYLDHVRCHQVHQIMKFAQKIWHWFFFFFFRRSIEQTPITYHGCLLIPSFTISGISIICFS